MARTRSATSSRSPHAAPDTANPQRPAGPGAGARLTAPVLRGLLRLFCPTTVTGVETLPKTAFVLCANHSSHCDGPVLAYASGLALRHVAVFAATDYFFARSTLADRLSLPFRLVPVDRSNVRKGLEDLRAGGRQALNDGCKALVIFPSGTRTRPGQTRPFRRGAALLAADLGVPLVPVHIKGTDHVLPRGRRVPRRGPVHVHFGAPLLPPHGGQSVATWSRDATTEIERRVAALGANVS